MYRFLKLSLQIVIFLSLTSMYSANASGETPNMDAMSAQMKEAFLEGFEDHWKNTYIENSHEKSHALKVFAAGFDWPLYQESCNHLLEQSWSNWSFAFKTELTGDNPPSDVYSFTTNLTGAPMGSAAKAYSYCKIYNVNHLPGELKFAGVSIYTPAGASLSKAFRAVFSRGTYCLCFK